MSNRHSLHGQIANYVCRKIVLGEWKEEALIPSAIDIATLFEVNVHMAQKAIQQLIDKQVVDADGNQVRVSAGATHKALEILREDFEQFDLPGLAQKMRLLNLNEADLISLLSRIQNQ